MVKTTQDREIGELVERLINLPEDDFLSPDTRAVLNKAQTAIVYTDLDEFTNEQILSAVVEFRTNTPLFVRQLNALITRIEIVQPIRRSATDVDFI